MVSLEELQAELHLAAGRVAGGSRRLAKDDPELLTARRDMALAKVRFRLAKLLEENLGSAITDEEADRICSVLADRIVAR